MRYLRSFFKWYQIQYWRQCVATLNMRVTRPSIHRVGIIFLYFYIFIFIYLYIYTQISSEAKISRKRLSFFYIYMYIYILIYVCFIYIYKIIVLPAVLVHLFSSYREINVFKLFSWISDPLIVFRSFININSHSLLD